MVTFISHYLNPSYPKLVQKRPKIDDHDDFQPINHFYHEASISRKDVASRDTRARRLKPKKALEIRISKQRAADNGHVIGYEFHYDIVNGTSKFHQLVATTTAPNPKKTFMKISSLTLGSQEHATATLVLGNTTDDPVDLPTTTRLVPYASRTTSNSFSATKGRDKGATSGTLRKRRFVMQRERWKNNE